MNYQFASRNNQETNTAVSYGSEDADESPPILNIDERGRNSSFFTGELRTYEGWQNSSRSREEIHVLGQSRHEKEDSKAGHLQQPDSFHNNSQAVPTRRPRHTPQNNQLPLMNSTGPDVHRNNAYNRALYIMAFQVSRVLRQTGCNSKH